MELAAKYNPNEVEDKWYKYWMKHNLFHSKPDDREPFTVVIPPPNVTGVLHMGHMLNNTIQDILVRRARMLGKNACWVPGTDHASIATEAKVVAKLASQGISKADLTRDEFLAHAWDWTHLHGGIILEQLKKLGASCDWDRTAFTLDETRSRSVFKVFLDLYKKGLIYRGVRMVNWDPAAKTALSDEEVVYKEEQSKLYYLKYKIVGEDGFAVVATTRPETIFGDVAVCVNPADAKTAHLKGKKVIVPIVNREIPIIEDEYVDPEFGTGFLKVTPAHDVNDYILGEKHNLESIDIFNDDGTLNKYGLAYEDLDRFDVRKKIEEDLVSLDLLVKAEPYTNKVGFSERTHVPIEPKLSMQWFLKMDKLVEPAMDAVNNGEIKFHPNKFVNTYNHWMQNIKDWCISRQLWWGHRIPAYYLPEGGYVVAETVEEALVEARKKSGNNNLQAADLRQDEDCLDTWFSSWLWPLSVFDGVNQPHNEEIEYYYPTNDLVTGPDIIFFWVARMIMAGYEYRHKPCFRNVYFTGIVRDKLGRKMSKQLGNSPDPLELIEKYGADGVRMGMLLTAPAGNDLPFDESLCEQGRNFNSKIWNAFRLIKGWDVDHTITQPNSSKYATEWFDAILSKNLAEVEDLFSKYKLSEALMLVYKLFWDEFSSWYLEMIKPAYQTPIDLVSYNKTIGYFDSLLRILHPFMPFITEELWQALSVRKEGESIMVADMPKAKNFSADIIASSEKLKNIISGIRTIRLQKNIPNKDSLELEILGDHDLTLRSSILKMGNISDIKTVTTKNPAAVSFLIGTTEYTVPLENNIDIEAELERLQTELKYQEGFYNSVMKKLSNEKFVANANPSVVENERKKLADSESKIHTLRESIKSLQK